MSGFLQSAGDWASGFWHDHWQMIVSVAAGAVVAVAVTAVIIGTMGTATPILFAAAGASGALSAGTTQTVDDLLEHKRPGLDVAESVVVGGAVSVATLGVGRLVSPLVPEAVAKFLPGQAVPAIADGGDLINVALRKNVPWTGIPRIIFNQSIPEIVQHAEIGIVGALEGSHRAKLDMLEPPVVIAAIHSALAARSHPQPPPGRRAELILHPELAPAPGHAALGD